MIHLDTNFLIDALVPGTAQEAKLAGWLSAGEPVSISAIAWGEFLCGPLSPVAENLARQLLPLAEVLTKTDAEKAAALFNQTGRRSKGFSDCCIAAIAMRAGASLATSNIGDFKGMLPLGLMLA
ncbi:MAG TPA: PIN domain-containing protein [Prosthecobacter sp.]